MKKMSKKQSTETCAGILNEVDCFRVGAESIFGKNSATIAGRPKAIVVMDWQNIFLSYKNQHNSPFGRNEMSCLDDYIHRYYDVITKRAYTDSSTDKSSKEILDDLDYTIVNVPSKLRPSPDSKKEHIKNAVDIELALSVYEDVLKIKGLSTVILLSGDGDFLPLVKRIKAKGIKIIIMSRKISLSRRLEKFANQVIYLEHLIPPTGESDEILPFSTQNEINRKLLKSLEKTDSGRMPLPKALQTIFGHLGVKSLKELGQKKARDMVENYPTMFKGLVIKENEVYKSINFSSRCQQRGDVLC